MLNKNVYDSLQDDFGWKRIQATIQGKEIRNNFRNAHGDVISLYHDNKSDVDFIEAYGRRYVIPTEDVIVKMSSAPNQNRNSAVARFIDMMADRIINGAEVKEQSVFDAGKGKRSSK